MSYCQPQFVSDYHYNRAFAHMARSHAPSAPGRTIVLTGAVDPDGRFGGLRSDVSSKPPLAAPVDAAFVTWSGLVLRALAAAEELAGEGIRAEVVDLRTLVPMDVDTIVTSVRKTGALLIVHEAMKRAGATGEVAMRVTEAAPEVVQAMKTPIRRLAAENVALPTSLRIERRLVPQVADIVRAAEELFQESM